MNVQCSTASAPDSDESEGKCSYKQLTDLTWGSNIGWSCSNLPNLCPGHSALMSLESLKAQGVSKMSLLLPFVPRPLQESGVTSLILGLCSPPRMLLLPSWNSSFPDLCRGATFTPLPGQVPALPRCPSICDGQSPLPHPYSIGSAYVGMAHWWFHSCCMVMQSAGQFKVDQLLLVLWLKHNAVLSTMGHTVVWLTTG